MKENFQIGLQCAKVLLIFNPLLLHLGNFLLYSVKTRFSEMNGLRENKFFCKNNSDAFVGY